jgi:hypothetical protein
VILDINKVSEKPGLSSYLKFQLVANLGLKYLCYSCIFAEYLGVWVSTYPVHPGNRQLSCQYHYPHHPSHQHLYLNLLYLKNDVSGQNYQILDFKNL